MTQNKKIKSLRKLKRRVDLFRRRKRLRKKASQNEKYFHCGVESH